MKNGVRIFAFLIFLAFVTAFGGCSGPSGDYDVNINTYKGQVLSRSDVEQMRRDHKRQFNEELRYDAYLGTYDGCAVLYVDTSMTAIGEIMVADVTLINHNSFSIKVYRDHTFYDLETAFVDGLISYENLKKVGIAHIEKHNGITDWNTPFDAYDKTSRAQTVCANLLSKRYRYLQLTPETSDIGNADKEIEILGKFNRAYVAVFCGKVAGDNPDKETVGEFTFDSHNGNLAVCTDTGYLTVTEALGNKVLRESDLTLIYDIYQRKYKPTEQTGE